MNRKISLYLDGAVIDELTKMAEERGSSISALVNNILKLGLDSRAEVLKELDTVNILKLVKGLKKAIKPLMRE